MALASLGSSTTADAETTQPAVLEDEIRSDVYFLASDRLEGRGVGTPGLDIAADYIATRFQSIGLKPLPKLNGYFQPFEITKAQSVSPSTTLTLAGKKLKLGADYTALSFSAEKSFSAPIVFAGYGITDKSRHYDDYAGIDTKGKVVLAFRFEPHDDKGKSQWGKDDWTSNSHLETKARVAAEHGAAALILITPPTFHDPADALLPFSHQFVAKISIPVLQLKRSAADQLLKQVGAPDVVELQKKLDAAAKPDSFALKDADATGNVAITRTHTKVKNVVGYIPGSGPLADEFVIVGAHYDHLGWGGEGSLMNMPTAHGAATQIAQKLANAISPATTQASPHAAHPTSMPVARAIHHGADDNASGTATVLELARIFAHRAKTQPPARSVIFATFTAEEAGLIGSAHFVKEPPIDLKRVVAMLNLDMVGRVRKNILYVGGGGTAQPFKNILKVEDLKSPLEFKNFGDGGLGPSDHMSFAVKKVPVLFLFSGNHADYHRPTDTADKVNYDGIADVVRMSVHLIDDLTEMPRSTYVDAADKGSMMNPMTAGDEGETRRASLGVVPEYGGEEDGKGVRISGTTSGTAAEKAGLQAGDVVLKLGDQPTSTLMELSTALNVHKPGDKVKLVYKRGEKEITTEITLGSRGG